MRIPVIAANWKMYKNPNQARLLVEDLLLEITGVSDRKVVLCPPFPALETVVNACRDTKVAVGGQNLYWENEGAFTGEVSAAMLAAVGCSYVIVGHSERRQYFGETDATVNLKLRAALAAGLNPIMCVGETLEQRETDITKAVCEVQLKAGLKGFDAKEIDRLVIAYEPVWAIGTGRTASSEDAQTVIAFLRKILAECKGEDAARNIPILYGGSVKPENIAELMAEPDIDGALVGGASLKADTFAAIVNY